LRTWLPIDAAIERLAAGWGASEPPGALGLLGLNLAFAGLWLVSAGLFWKASRTT
jgi:hypothetical protein